MKSTFDRSSRAAPRVAGLVVWAGLHAAVASAGGFNVAVADAATGKPLADAVALLEPTGAKVPVVPMADVEISQARRRFDPKVTVITVGTKALFPNFDTVRHHVYSFSATKPFELKLYAGVPNEPVVFDKPGIAVLGCNIHDTMAAWVVVADTPWFARSGADGQAHIGGVPPGSYRLRVWHPGLASNAEPMPASVIVSGADVERQVRLAVVAEP